MDICSMILDAAVALGALVVCAFVVWRNGQVTDRVCRLAERTGATLKELSLRSPVFVAERAEDGAAQINTEVMVDSKPEGPPASNMPPLAPPPRSMNPDLEDTELQEIGERFG